MSDQFKTLVLEELGDLLAIVQEESLAPEQVIYRLERLTADLRSIASAPYLAISPDDRTD